MYLVPDIRPTMMGSENRKQNRFSLPESIAVGSDGSFLYAAYTRKYVLFVHSA